MKSHQYQEEMTTGWFLVQFWGKSVLQKPNHKLDGFLSSDPAKQPEASLAVSMQSVSSHGGSQSQKRPFFTDKGLRTQRCATASDTSVPHLSTSVSPGCSSESWESNRRLSKCLGHSTHIGNPEGVPVSWLRFGLSLVVAAIREVS